MIYCILYGVWWGFLRRWFGGLFPEEQFKLLGNRGIQTAIMLISLFPVMLQICLLRYPTYSLISVLIIASFMTSWIQFQFWSRGHGGTFADMGRDKNPDISRYDRWFKFILDISWNFFTNLKENYKIFNWLLQRWSAKKYGYTYDMLYHTLRYTLCMFVPALMLKKFVFIFIGLLSAPIYEINLRLYEKFKFKWMQLSWLNSANKLSEIELGFIFGFSLLLCIKY